MSVVDQETRKRMNDGFREKFGEDMDRTEEVRFYRLAKLSRMDPLVNTFKEIDAGIKKITKQWKPRGRYAKSKARKA